MELEGPFNKEVQVCAHMLMILSKNGYVNNTRH
jgi:hypothetical protein